MGLVWSYVAWCSEIAASRNRQFGGQYRYLRRVLSESSARRMAGQGQRTKLDLGVLVTFANALWLSIFYHGFALRLDCVPEYLS